MTTPSITTSSPVTVDSLKQASQALLFVAGALEQRGNDFAISGLLPPLRAKHLKPEQLALAGGRVHATLWIEAVSPQGRLLRVRPLRLRAAREEPDGASWEIRGELHATEPGALKLFLPHQDKRFMFTTRLTTRTQHLIQPDWSLIQLSGGLIDSLLVTEEACEVRLAPKTQSPLSTR